MTVLDETLREIALTDWKAFVALVGKKAIIDAKVCLLRKSGKSWGEISNKMDVSVGSARNSCKKCEVKN